MNNAVPPPRHYERPSRPVYMMWPSLVSRTVPLYRVGSTQVLFPFKILIVFIWEGWLARFAKIPVARAEISASKPPRLFRESVDKLLLCYHWNKNSRAKILHRVSHIFGFQKKYFYRYYYFFNLYSDHHEEWKVLWCSVGTTDPLPVFKCGRCFSLHCYSYSFNQFFFLFS